MNYEIEHSLWFKSFGQRAFLSTHVGIQNEFYSLMYAQVSSLSAKNPGRLLRAPNEAVKFISHVKDRPMHLELFSQNEVIMCFLRKSLVCPSCQRVFTLLWKKIYMRSYNIRFANYNSLILICLNNQILTFQMRRWY